MKRKVPLTEGTLLLGVVMVVFFPPTFVCMMVGGAMVEGVKWCQKKCCGIVEDEDLELEEGAATQEDENGSVNNEVEEREGLMGKVDS